jgi:hypothetical protein
MTAKRADFDGDGRAEIPVTSPWGLGILELAGGSLNAPTMQPNGTRFGGWLLNTADNRFDLMGDLDGDGRVEMFVSSPWGVGVLEQAGSTFGCPMLAPNGTRFRRLAAQPADNRFGPLFPLAYSSSPAGPPSPSVKPASSMFDLLHLLAGWSQRHGSWPPEQRLDSADVGS